MRNIVLALVVTVASIGVATAQTSKPESKAAQTTRPAASAKMTPAKPHTMKAEVVSTDATAKTITVKDASGQTTTLTAKGGAVASLAKLQAGDNVTITANDTTATRIVKAKSTMAKGKSGKGRK